MSFLLANFRCHGSCGYRIRYSPFVPKRRSGKVSKSLYETSKADGLFPCSKVLWRHKSRMLVKHDRSCCVVSTKSSPFLLRKSGLWYMRSSATFIDVELPGINFSRQLHESKSKVEETVQRLHERHSQRISEIAKMSDVEERVKSAWKLDQETVNAVVEARKMLQTDPVENLPTPAKKTLWQKVIQEVQHYKSGFILLFYDVKVSTKILGKVLKGRTLTRRENRQLVRTVGDLFRLVPFLVFIIVPFMEFLLPLVLAVFPGMLPSTFTTSNQREAKYRRQLVAKLEYAKFLQKTLEEMSPTDRDRNSQSARDFVEFYQRIKTIGTSGSVVVDNKEILKFSTLFEDHITLDNMTRSQLVALCRLLELPTVGANKNILAFSLEMKLRSLRADDRVLQREGLERLTYQELQSACKERGMRALGLSTEALITHLQQWLDLSLNAKVPPSLLLLSRTLFLPEHLDPCSQLAATISVLPESAAKTAGAEVAEKEGKIRNVVRLEQIKEEQRKIDEEAAEEATKQQELDKEQQQKLSLAQNENIAAPVLTAAPTAESIVSEATETIRKATVSSDGELLEKSKEQLDVPVDKAEVLTDEPSGVDVIPPVSDGGDSQLVDVLMEKQVGIEGTQKVVEPTTTKVPIDQRELSADDFEGLKSAIEKLGRVPKTSSEEVDDLKKGLEDYKEDVEDLEAIAEIVERKGLKESKGAQRLFSRVNKMLGKMEPLVKVLEEKKKVIVSMASEEGRTVEEQQQDQNRLITVNELLDAVHSMERTTTDSVKLDQIADILSLMDEDHDGVIRVDHVYKVIELLGTSQAKLPSKQIKQIVEMLAKEEMLEAEGSIEDVLDTANSSENPDVISYDKDPDVSEDDQQNPQHIRDMFRNTEFPVTKKEIKK